MFATTQNTQQIGLSNLNTASKTQHGKFYSNSFVSQNKAESQSRNLTNPRYGLKKEYATTDSTNQRQESSTEKKQIALKSKFVSQKKAEGI